MYVIRPPYEQQPSLAFIKKIRMFKIKNYINGELVNPASGNYIDNYNPATGEIYSLIPDSGNDDVETAVE